ncbi:copper resistance protein CopC [Euzebya sp.]|uniref:copper resistance CopC family protein n=1 Tax=Euzebya sp. TaxID=1971409 RepID=UPI003511D7FC
MAHLRILLAVTALLVLTAIPASAHTELAETVPAEAEEVADPPSEVRLTFTAALQPGSTPEVSVVDPNGDDLVAAPPTVDGVEVIVPLNLAVTPGVHTVEWAVTAVDGHPLSGSYAFAFTPPADVATPPVPTATTTATATPTPTASASTPPAPSPSEVDLAADDGGVSGLWVVLVSVAAVAAAGAVVVTRLRNPDQHG